MNWFAGRWWRGFGFRRADAPEADPADMGTVFGLDSRVDGLDPEWPTLDPIGAAPVPSWDDRLIRRSGL